MTATINSKLSPQREMNLPPPISGPSTATEHRTFGFDTETFYCKGYDLKALGVDRYVADKKFDCYLVSFWGPHGQFVGHPKDCPWHDFSGCIWVSHNSRFDRAVFFRLKELGIVPADVAPREWHDTAALAVYLQAPRRLEGAAQHLLGRKPRKAALVGRPVKGVAEPEIAGELGVFERVSKKLFVLE